MVFVMPTISLGRREISSLRPTPGRPVTYFDAKLSGFGLRYHSSGHASFIFEYRPVKAGRNASKRRITLGAVGTLTLEEAKAFAKDLKAHVRLGGDPMHERQLARRAQSMERLVRAYLDDHVTPKRKATTLELYEGYLRSHIAPRQDRNDSTSSLLPGSLGGKKAIDLTRQEVARFHKETGKHRPRTANAVITLIAAAYTWGSKNGELPVDHCNPAKGIERFPEQSRERFLRADEFARLGETLRLAETEGLAWEPRPNSKTKHAPRLENRIVKIDQFAIAAIRLLIFTGARLREILNLEWSQLDYERGLLLLPTSKTGKKTIVLTAPALAVLATLPRIGRFVIASSSAGANDEKPRADLHRPWARITAHANLDGLRIHDLRHSFASIGVGSGMGLPIIGRLLGHLDVKTTQKYSHLETDPVRRAGDAIALRIEAQLGGQTAVMTSTPRQAK